MEQAVTWYKRAAEAGHAKAMYNLGWISSERGELEQAAMWYQRAADVGELQAMSQLARLEQIGEDLPRGGREHTPHSEREHTGAEGKGEGADREAQGHLERGVSRENSLVDAILAKPPPWWKGRFRRKQRDLPVPAAEVEKGRISPAMNAEALVERLLSQPRYVSELEGIVGPIRLSFRPEDQENIGFLFRPRLGQEGEFSPLIPRLSISYEWDRQHEDPTEPRDVKVLEYELHLRGDRAAVERILLGRFGEPRHVVERFRDTTGEVSMTEYAAYHPFYVTGSRFGNLTLAWFATVPRFAIPDPDADARRAWLEELRARVETARSVDDIDALCRAAPPSVGIEIGGTLNKGLNPYAAFKFPLPDARDYWIRFVPPVGAHVLIEAFGWAPAVGVSQDVHMSSWHIERRGAHWRPISGALQHWEIDARLAGWPSGPWEPDAEPGPSSPRGIGEADEVTSLAIQPRFQ